MVEVVRVKRDFKKYSSIENSYREEWINKIKEQRPNLAKGTWAITEKVHGTNVQFGYDGYDYTVGKRTGFIEEGEKFYNIEKQAEHYEGAIKAIYEHCKDVYDCDGIICYGELFGGSYPHKEVERDNTAQKVQKGVYYCPMNEIMFFDIFMYKEDIGFYLPVKEFEQVMDAVKDKGYIELIYQHSILVDGIDNAIKYPNDEPSQMYKIWGLPELEDNIREGIVIKPYELDDYIGQARVIIKSKNDRFVEKSHEGKTPKAPVEIPENVKICMEEISKYITENRVTNVISHVGEVTEKDIGKIIGLTSKDVLDDYTKDYKLPEDKEQSKMVTKYLQAEVAKVVRKVILR